MLYLAMVANSLCASYEVQQDGRVKDKAQHIYPARREHEDRHRKWKISNAARFNYDNLIVQARNCRVRAESDLPGPFT